MDDGTLTWVEIDLDAIEDNVRAFRHHVGSTVEIIAIVKADGYGHGAVPVARAALAAGATRLGVHRVSEGVALRRAGIEAPVLVMGYMPPGAAGAVVQHRLTPTVIDADVADALSREAAQARTVVPVHLKVDTGMGRYGVLPDETVGFARRLAGSQRLRLEGVYTHFATADAADPAVLLSQLDGFRRLTDDLERAGLGIPLRHAANSAATMRLPASWLDAVRPGLALYGLVPSDQWPAPFAIRPALTWKSRIVRVRELPSGSGISYGHTYVTQRATRVALVPVGYGDGYHRSLSGVGTVLVGGCRAPVRGRVCMDQIVVDVDAIPGVARDDEVVLVGTQGSGRITAEEVAALAGTINYEVTTAILPRVTRLYLRGGRDVTAREVPEGSQSGPTRPEGRYASDR
jgi:alanine racemase